MFNKILTTLFVLAVIATVFIYANMSEARTVVTEGLVSYWDFDHITGKTVKDMWGNNDGTIQGNPKIVEGKVGQALQFDGKDDYVDCGNDKSLNFERKDSFSICAWIKTDGLVVAYQTIVSKMEDPWIGYLFMISGTPEPNNPSALGLVLSNTNVVNDIVCYSPNNSMTTDWNFVCVTYAGKSNVAGIRLYLNGKNQQISTVRDGLSATMLTPTHLEIGHEAVADYPLWFNGLIDEVSIYNQVLSEAEVSQNFVAEGLAVVKSTKKLALTWGEIKVSR